MFYSVKDLNIFRKKIVIVTGNTGFKGSWLTLWLKLLGARVIGVSFNTPTKPSHFQIINNDKSIKNYICDIKNFNELKRIIEVIDQEPVFNASMMKLFKWAASYYHYPLGQVIHNAMPAHVRQGKALTASNNNTVKHEEIIKDLTKELVLNKQQEQVKASILKQSNNFHCFLLEGITGSGKTEVYMQLIAEKIRLGLQVIMLVPEISLTPQTIQHFQGRFADNIVAIHSGLTDKQRFNAWSDARLGDADIVIGTDPDADRVGLAVKNHKGDYIILNGNQMMILLTEYILSKKENLDQSFFIGSTVVSTNMIKHIANNYNVDFKVGLTGFKWIGKMINDYKNQKFISGGEESYGYMVGDFVRDKDAITSALVACELGSECKTNNSSIIDYLINCYIKYGFYKERLISIKKEGAKGLEEISEIMNSLRTSGLKMIDGCKLKFIKDFESSSKQDLVTGNSSKLDFPKSNVLIFEAEDGTTVAARPSGTEPKIKFYISVNSKLESKSDYVKMDTLLENKIERVIKEFEF